jgi:3-oxoacyl-[acyl-carrier protein] reductase
MGSAASAQIAGSTTAAPPGGSRAAVVTGSSRGIGAATALRLAHDGYAVTFNYLSNRDLAAQVVRDIEAACGRAIARQGDVADHLQSSYSSMPIKKPSAVWTLSSTTPES